ncbi:hypothetical protein AURDEDRAFT_174726 [Auricularia subglabra TFB-10046 SS5]|nr:hypothetical protein AURDEDRAFT_174726 [Auricularia subglabra TFB-10046 SS5]
MACAQSPAVEGLYGVVRSALDSSTGDLCKLGVESANLVVNAASSNVHRAIADFAESWNETNPSLLSSLPNELQISCLESLSLEELVTASHVSRGWRKLILDAPTLWNEVSPRHRPYTLVAFFETVMARSGSVPLVVEIPCLEPWPLPDSACEHAAHDARRLRELLMTAIPKIRSLTVGLRLPDDPIVWRTPAPLLDSLHVVLEPPQTGLLAWTSIPELWWTTCVPGLKVLRLESFKLPASYDPANRLELFQGDMCINDSSGQMYEADARLLFLHFPHLVTLRLSCVYNASMLPNTPPPPSLRYVYLDALRHQGATDDLSSLLHGWRNSSLEKINLHKFQQFTIVDAVKHFSSQGTGPWELITARWGDTLLRTLCNTGGFTLEFSPARYSKPSALAFSAAHFIALHSLTLSGEWIRPFLLADPDLPALVSLVFSDDITSTSSSFSRGLADGSVLPLRTPSLQRVTFTIQASDDDGQSATAFRIRAFLRTRVRYDAPLLQRITLAVRRWVPELAFDARVLCPLASEIVCEGAGGEVSFISPAAGSHETADSVSDGVVADSAT